MKRLNLKTLILGVILCASTAVFMFSCDDMNSLHEEFLERGEGIYLGPADSLQVYSGYRKVRLQWKINADPRITQSVVYWNQREASKTIPVNRTTGGYMWMETEIDDLNEAMFIFEVQLKDDMGNVSKPALVTGVALGDIFLNGLQSRTIKEITWLESGVDVAVTWENIPSPTLLYTIIKYMDETGSIVTIEVQNNETNTVLEGINSANNNIEVYSVYKPVDGFETYNSANRNYKAVRWVNITDEAKMINTKAPFTSTVDGPPGMQAGRFLWVTDWIHNEDAKKCSTWESGYTGVLSLYTNGSAAYNFTNAKLYQTVTLDEGRYRFDVTLIRNMCTATNRVFIVAADGDDLPDFNNVASASLAQAEYELAPGGSIIYAEGSRPVKSIEFELTSTKTVSLGFVAAASSNFLHQFEKVELFTER